MAVGPHRLVYMLRLVVQVGHDVARAILIILQPKQVLVESMSAAVIQTLIAVRGSMGLDLNGTINGQFRCFEISQWLKFLTLCSSNDTMILLDFKEYL